jgi:hypothetical protein
MESKILYDPNKRYEKELKRIEEYVEEDLKDKLKGALGYLKYIIGKEPRWVIREAYPHMHNNLNIAIEPGICCLYYINRKYAPADDRKLYYTYEPIIIAGRNSSAVLVSEDVWRSIEETLYLNSIPGMKDSIISGMQEKIEDCSGEIEW